MMTNPTYITFDYEPSKRTEKPVKWLVRFKAPVEVDGEISLGMTEYLEEGEYFLPNPDYIGFYRIGRHD